MFSFLEIFTSPWFFVVAKIIFFVYHVWNYDKEKGGSIDGPH